MNISDDSYETIIDKLEQAYAVSSILMADGVGIDGFTSNHKIVINSLWAIHSLIDNAKKELEEASEKVVKLKKAA